MVARVYNDFAPTATLAGAVDGTAVNITLSSVVGFPTSYPYTATLDLGQSNAELVLVTSAISNTVTVTRNYNGQGAFSHSAGSGTFNLTSAAIDFREANAHVNASQQVHGLGAGSSVVGTTDAQTLTNKTLSAPTFTGEATGPVRVKGPAGILFAARNVADTSDIFTVDTTGNINMAGALGALGNINTSAGTVSGNAVTTNGNGNITPGGIGQLSGIVVPKVYANEAARDAAITAPTNGMTVYLTAPTGHTPPGLFLYAGGWVPLSQQVIQHGTFSVTLSGGLAQSVPVTFATAFPGTPEVTLDVSPITNNTPVSWGLTGVTSTGFSYTVKFGSGSNNLNGRYIAVYG